jgi:hypothetical protein
MRVMSDDEWKAFLTDRPRTAKLATVRSRVALCVDDDRPPFSFVIIEGTAELSEDPDDLLAWATRIGGRYMGAAQAETYGKRNGVPGELLVRVRPDHVVARVGISD